MGACLRGGANLGIYGIYFFMFQKLVALLREDYLEVLILLNSNLFLYLQCKF